MFIVSLLIGVWAVVLAIILALIVLSRKPKSEKMIEIAGYIRTGANAYLLRQTRTILYLVPFLFLVIYLLFGWKEAVSAVIGIITSLLASFFGMSVCVRANLQTADVAGESPSKSFRTAVYGGSVMGLCIIGFSLIVLSILFLIFRSPTPLVGFGVGSSLAALFAQIGGGIFTKSADVGADLVGKLEEKIPEDDPRNAAVIADLVGDNVGDCAGRGADLFQTLSDDIITGSIVAVALIPRYGPKVIFFPILLQCVGVISSSVGILSTRQWKMKMSPSLSFNIGLWVNTILAAIGSFFLIKYLLRDNSIFLAVVLGIATTLIAAVTTKFFAGMDSDAVKKIAASAKRGAALSLITGFAYGLKSPIASVIMIVASIIFAFNSSGGLLLAIVGVNIGTDLLIAYIMASDAFGPIVDNATGIAKMSKAPENVVSSLSSLDSVGNTMKAITKAYAMSSGTVTAFVTFATFFTLTNIKSIDVTNPFGIGFLLLGATLPYLISSLTIGSTAKAAQSVVDEVRRQFREIKGIMDGSSKPDYARCVDIATKNALREMVLPGVISFLAPVLVGFIFGANALGALLIGAVLSAALLGPFFNNTGTAWDNAKKLIEHNKRLNGSYQHESAVVGDTVGDPFKDVAGPSLLIFMKLIGMTSLLVAPLLH